MTCGACGNKGRSRSMKCCPLYYNDEEVERRNAAKMVSRLVYTRFFHSNGIIEICSQLLGFSEMNFNLLCKQKRQETQKRKEEEKKRERDAAIEFCVRYSG